MLQFRPVTIQDKEIIDDFIKEKQYWITEYSFTYMMLWNRVVFFEVCITEQALYFRCSYEGERFYFLPVVKDGNLEAHYKELEVFADGEGQPWELICIDDINLQLLSPAFLENYVLERDVDYCEYIYRSEDLIGLKGKKYHSKRNHISKFNKLYDYTFLPLTKEDFAECLAFNNQWLEEKSEAMSQDMQDEVLALEDCFTYYDQLGLVGACIRIDGKLEGFAIGEYAHETMAVVHFEKCNPAFDGIYAAMNQMFAEKYFSKIPYINRQDDIGLEGLRKAKQSYHPVFMGEKYFMVRKEEKQ